MQCRRRLRMTNYVVICINYTLMALPQTALRRLEFDSCLINKVTRQEMQRTDTYIVDTKGVGSGGSGGKYPQLWTKGGYAIPTLPNVFRIVGVISECLNNTVAQLLIVHDGLNGYNSVRHYQFDVH